MVAIDDGTTFELQARTKRTSGRGLGTVFSAAAAREINTPAMEGRINSNGNPGLVCFMLLFIDVIRCSRVCWIWKCKCQRSENQFIHNRTAYPVRGVVVDRFQRPRFFYSRFEKGCPTNAYQRARQCRKVLWVTVVYCCLIEDQGVSA